jgi:hypothetical protein
LSVNEANGDAAPEENKTPDAVTDGDAVSDEEAVTDADTAPKEPESSGPRGAPDTAMKYPQATDTERPPDYAIARPVEIVEPPEPEPSGPRSERWRLECEIPFYTGGGPGLSRVTVISPLLEVAFHAGDHLDLEAGMGLSQVWLEADGASQNATRTGNLLLGPTYIDEIDGFDFRLDVSVAAPSSHIRGEAPNSATVEDLEPFDPLPLSTQYREEVDQRFADAVAYAYASAIRGLWNPWYWDADRPGVLATIRIDRALGPRAAVGLEAGAGAFFWTRDGEESSNDAGHAQIGIDFAYALARAWRLGANLRLAYDGSQHGPESISDGVQLSTEPTVSWHMADNASLDLGLVVNINAPYGFGLDADRVWGLRTGASLEL